MTFFSPSYPIPDPLSGRSLASCVKLSPILLFSNYALICVFANWILFVITSSNLVFFAATALGFEIIIKRICLFFKRICCFLCVIECLTGFTRWCVDGGEIDILVVFGVVTKFFLDLDLDEKVDRWLNGSEWNGREIRHTLYGENFWKFERNWGRINGNC